MVRKRKTEPPAHNPPPVMESPRTRDEAEYASRSAWAKTSRRTQWLLLAVASGACAAFNGVFAKLTTTELTTSWASGISGAFGLAEDNKFVEVVIRALFFGLNLIFNGIMWALFTAALARATSTTQVSIINTSANFMITAVLGVAIFSESLKPVWWLGASLLVVGNVIIGRRDEGDKAAIVPPAPDTGVEHLEEVYREEGETDDLLGEAVSLHETNRKTNDVDDPL